MTHPFGSTCALQSLNFPNFPSTTDRVTVQFNDFTQRRASLGGRPASPGPP